MRARFSWNMVKLFWWSLWFTTSYNSYTIWKTNMALTTHKLTYIITVQTIPVKQTVCCLAPWKGKTILSVHVRLSEYRFSAIGSSQRSASTSRQILRPTPSAGTTLLSTNSKWLDATARSQTTRGLQFSHASWKSKFSWFGFSFRRKGCSVILRRSPCHQVSPMGMESQQRSWKCGWVLI